MATDRSVTLNGICTSRSMSSLLLLANSHEAEAHHSLGNGYNEPSAYPTLAHETAYVASTERFDASTTPGAFSQLSRPRPDDGRWSGSHSPEIARRQTWSSQANISDQHAHNSYGYPAVRIPAMDTHQNSMGSAYPMSALTSDPSPMSDGTSLFNHHGGADMHYHAMINSQGSGMYAGYAGYATPATSYAPTPAVLRSNQSLIPPVYQQRPSSSNSQQQQQQYFKEVPADPRNKGMTFSGPFVRQRMYKPHTSADKKRYVEDVQLDVPLLFEVIGQEQLGLPLTEAMQPRGTRLTGGEGLVFEDKGPSVSIRIEVSKLTPFSSQRLIVDIPLRYSGLVTRPGASRSRRGTSRILQGRLHGLN
jgi:hypothetical protein